MKKFILIAAFLVAACNEPLPKLPAPPAKVEVITNNVPVPVLCKQDIERRKKAIDDVEEKLPLESQNSVLRQTVAQQKAYIILLESGIIACGGKITDR